MLKPATLLVYCGRSRQWTDEEVGMLVRLAGLEEGAKYNLLLLDVCTNHDQWEEHSVGMLGRLSAQASLAGLEMPQSYVASWGTESQGWAEDVQAALGEGFLGLYWNGGEERPEVPPPSEPLHDMPWELWIPYSAGTWGIGNVARAVAESGFPPGKIALQPNVYQPIHKRGWLDMVRSYYYARRFGIKLEMEFDENMHSGLRYYRWLDRLSPSIFTCVYGGLKHILRVDEVV